MFGEGDLVVCINDNDPPQGEGPKVVLNQVYTVTKMEVKGRPIGRLGPMIIMKPEWYVHLAEVPSPRGVGFFAFRFRKVEKKSKETDITIFKEIAGGTRVVPLEDAPVKVPEKVE